MNLTSRFKSILHNDGNKKVLGTKIDKIWKWTTRETLKNNVLYCVDVLKNNNVQENDRIMYKGNNSVNWVSWDIATNALGATFVPLYENQNSQYVNHIIEDCVPRLFITNGFYNNVNLLKDNIESKNYNSEIPETRKNNLSKLIYTSGTTGKPKGVMLSHENILSNIENIEKRFSDLQFENTYTSLNILPWAHIYGLTTELYYNILNNNKIALCSGPQEFVTEMREIEPDLLYLVPRVLQMIKNKLQFFDKPFIRMLLPLIIKRIFGKNLITIFVGGSQLDETTKAFYKQYDVNICEGYGCTETSPMISVNHSHSPRNEQSVGKTFENTIVKIIDHEICVSGPGIMQGYYNNGEATKSVFVEQDGVSYYKTGDEGVCIQDFIFYKGRISENYKLSNGKFVNVNDIENVVKKHTPNLFVIYGNNKDYNIIICEKDSNLKHDVLDVINKELDTYLHIKKICYLEIGSFQDILTPKMSIKRKELEIKFQQQIEEIYK